MITQIDPPGFESVSTVQIDSGAADPWAAIDEIENWAHEHGFVRTNEYHPRQVIINGQRRFRAICYRISPEERDAIELAHRRMIERGETLQVPVSNMARD